MYGFVYIWYDKKHKRYYVGSHKGSFDDGYICSSSWMNKAYKRRPKDFKRRILSIITTNRTDLLAEEQKYLDMIQDTELGKKYYNLKKNAYGGFTNQAYIAKRKAQLDVPLSDEHRKNISKALKGKPWTKKRRESEHGNYTRRLVYEHNGKKIGNIDDAIEYANVAKSTINRWCDNNLNEWRKYYVS